MAMVKYWFAVIHLMKTYLVVWFSSEGKSVTEVTDRLMSMGFRPMHGNYDYVYDWDKSASMDEVFTIGEKVQETLRGCGVTFKLESA